jgi:hypothetical protein
MSDKLTGRLAILLASISSAALTTPATAQDTTPSSTGVPSRATVDVPAGDIIVQARRVNERLQDVPSPRSIRAR